MELDAGCEPGSPMLDVFSDDDTVWVVLFASVLYEGDEAIQKRAAEWKELFGGKDG